MSTPLLSRRAAGRRSRIGLAVRRLGGRLIRGLAGVALLLLRRLVNLRSIVRVVVLSRQGVRRARLGMLLLLAVVMVPRLLLRWLRVAGLGRGSCIRGGSLMAVGGLLMAIVVTVVRLVVAAAIGATATSTAMTAARRTVRGIAGRGRTRGRRRRSRRRRAVVVSHGSRLRYFFVRGVK